MKNLKVTFKGTVEQAKIVDGKKGKYVKLEIKHGFSNKLFTYSRDLTLIDLMPTLEYDFHGIIREYDKKYSMEVISFSK